MNHCFKLNLFNELFDPVDKTNPAGTGRQYKVRLTMDPILVENENRVDRKYLMSA